MALSEFSDVVKRIIEDYVRSCINTTIPAKVLSVDNLESEQLIDVAPQLNDLFRDGKVIEYPPILDVPVQFPSAGGGILSFPIKVGDVVMLQFSMRSLDEWKDSRETDEHITPRDRRAHSYPDAIAVPCLYSTQTTLNPNPTDVELKFGDSLSFRMTPDNEAILTNGNATVTLNQGNEVILSNSGGSLTLKANGEVLHHTGAKISTSGDFITAAGISLDTHTHTGSPTAPPGPQSDTGAPK